jgi:hypothetical protein
MTERPGAIFVAEGACAVASAVFALLTLVWRDWIELTFGVDPDHHAGSLEWLIAVGLVALALVFGAMARLERRRRVPRPQAAGSV